MRTLGILAYVCHSSAALSFFIGLAVFAQDQAKVFAAVAVAGDIANLPMVAGGHAESYQCLAQILIVPPTLITMGMVLGIIARARVGQESIRPADAMM